MKKQRLIVLTDIAQGFELDDIESMVRLLLYSNEIDIEGLITCTSCWYKEAAKEENHKLILDLVDAYKKIKKNLDVHAAGYPSARSLEKITYSGIDKYGNALGDGWAEEWMNDNPGMNRIIEMADKEDERPLWISLWGGANTLAHAIWKISQERSEEELYTFLSKLRIYGISDQDHSGHWIRSTFQGKVFYIVSPSPGDCEGEEYYCKATWPGVSRRQV